MRDKWEASGEILCREWSLSTRFCGVKTGRPAEIWQESAARARRIPISPINGALTGLLGLKLMEELSAKQKPQA
jgi:hypothetical protein